MCTNDTLVSSAKVSEDKTWWTQANDLSLGTKDAVHIEGSTAE